MAVKEMELEEAERIWNDIVASAVVGTTERINVGSEKRREAILVVDAILRERLEHLKKAVLFVQAVSLN